MAAKITDRTKVLRDRCIVERARHGERHRSARRMTHAVGALLVVDAVHYAPHFSRRRARMDPDFLLCSGYKFYGPHVGVLYSKPGAPRSLADRSLEACRIRRHRTAFETGTLNHAAIDGMRAAVDYLAVGVRCDVARAHRRRHERHLRLRTWIGESYHDAVRRLPGVRVWGP